MGRREAKRRLCKRDFLFYFRKDLGREEKREEEKR